MRGRERCDKPALTITKDMRLSIDLLKAYLDRIENPSTRDEFSEAIAFLVGDIAGDEAMDIVLKEFGWKTN